MVKGPYNRIPSTGCLVSPFPGGGLPQQAAQLATSYLQMTDLSGAAATQARAVASDTNSNIDARPCRDARALYERTARALIGVATYSRRPRGRSASRALLAGSIIAGGLPVAILPSNG
jgi:hypothetical protein